MKKLLSIMRNHIVPLMNLMRLGFAWLILNLFYRKLFKEKIWLVCEKRSEARDNGYWFYKYVREKHPEINAYYVITKDSADLHKVEILGNVIYANTFRHAMCYLAAEKNISSQQSGAYPYNFPWQEQRLAQKLCRRDQKVVFLQHGIIQNEISHRLMDYGKAGMDYFVCSANREYQFVKETYGYPDNAIGNIGLCRFDNLYDAQKEKIVLVMPTWRIATARRKSGVALTQNETDHFTRSEYYRQFKALLTSEELASCLRKCGYQLVFYLHYMFQDYSELFEEFSNDVVCIADRYRYDVQDLLKRASILVTDYSSIHFDFAYMNKPLVYFQFDQDAFYAGQYARGYFQYERDGFGPCCVNFRETLLYLRDLIRNDGQQPEVYQKRVDDFFDVRDNKNCERNYDAVFNL